MATKEKKLRRVKMNLDNIIKGLIHREGGYVDHPCDTGGPTKYGITLDILSKFWGRPAKIEDVKELSIDLAKSIYISLYYIKPHIEALPEAIQEHILDMAVNHGTTRAAKMLQMVLNEAGFNCGLIDGMIGKLTVDATQAALEDIGAVELNNLLVTERLTFYHRIVARNPNQRG